VPAAAPAPPVSPETRRVLFRLCALFSLDAVGGGFLATTLLTVIFQEKFGASDTAVSLLFAAASVLNAVSHLGAAWLARRIGLVNTMVFTHIPGSLLLVTVAYAPSFPVAALLFLLREGLVEMDVPTRQSYVMAVVRPEERTAASGATSLVRVGGWAAGSWITGRILGSASAAATLPLVIAAGMKITYDVLLWGSFRRLKPPEER
jgi:predicted MFS family arabinose efflux permease